MNSPQPKVICIKKSVAQDKNSRAAWLRIDAQTGYVLSLRSLTSAQWLGLRPDTKRMVVKMLSILTTLGLSGFCNNFLVDHHKVVLVTTVLITRCQHCVLFASVSNIKTRYHCRSGRIGKNLLHT